MPPKKVAAVDRKQLYNVLGFKDGKLPEDGHIFKDVNCPNVQGDTVVTANVIIKEPSGKGRRSTHRVIIECPKCGKPVPFGRYHQHIDTKACQAQLPENKRVNKKTQQEPGHRSNV